MKRSWLLALLAALMLPGCASAPVLPDEPTGNALDLYISAGGRDHNSGTRASPFATIERARNEVRSRIASLPPGDIVVHIIAGEYVIGQTLHFTADDSGTASNPVIYRAEGEAVLTGGIRIDEKSMKKPTGSMAKRLSADALPHIRAVDLKKLGLTADDWGQLYPGGAYNTAGYYDGDWTGINACELFCGGRRLTVARYPDEGQWLTIRRVIAQGQNSVNTPDWSGIRNPEPGVFTLDNAAAEAVADWKSWDDAWMFGYFFYDWADMTTPVQGYDHETRQITPQLVSIYGYKDQARFYLFNIPEALDAPGEWYLDRATGMLYVYPPQDGGGLVLSMAGGDLISVDGANDIAFEGLTLSHTRGGGIHSRGDRIAVRNCTITGIAGDGIAMNGCGNTVTDCHISRIGRNAIVFGGGDFDTLTPSGNAAVGNNIHDWSELQRTYCGAVNISGVGVTVSRNTIYSAPHLAILYTGNDHIIEYNDFSGVCTETIDGGAVYAGRDYTWRGTIIRYNYFHDISSVIGDPICVYFDDALCGQTVYGNIFENCNALAVLAGGGRDIIIKNNVFINVNKAIHYDDRARNGFLENGWFAHMVLPEHTALWDSLERVPWQNDIWRARYPELAAMSTDRADPNAAAFACNPSGSYIGHNIIYGRAASEHDKFAIAKSYAQYSEMDINHFVEPGDARMAAYEAHGIRALADLSAFGLDGINIK